MQGINALQSMKSVREEWLAEADTVYLSIVNAGGLAESRPTKSKPRRERQLSSGWITAAACAAVGLCVYLAILLIGRNAGHGQPVGSEPGSTVISETEHRSVVTKRETEAETLPDTDVVTDADTATEAVTSILTEADTESVTEPYIPQEPEEGRIVRSALEVLRRQIDNAVYATQEMYVVHPQADGTEKSTLQKWAKDTASGNARLFRSSRIEPGYVASGTDNVVTLINDQLYFAKAIGANGRQSKKRNTLTEKQQKTLLPAIDQRRMPLPTSEYGDLTNWQVDAAMGHRYIWVTVREVADSLIDRLLTAAGYDTASQEITVSDVQCNLYFEVKNPDMHDWEVLTSSGLHTEVRMTVTASSYTAGPEQLIFDIREFGTDGQKPRITEPENWYSGYSQETDSATLTKSVLAVLGPQTAYGEITMYVTAAALKVRTTPDFGSDDNVIDYLKSGEAVTVIGETDTYYIIRLDGFPAYVGKTYLSPDKP
ncbi:MAG: SH3 domain-containing protein [Clostridia bacterium]|nr:SH3 domain-containing protein [Clostridia bacterium]